MKPQRNLPVNVPVKNTKGDELGTLQSKVSYIDGKSEGLYVKYNENGQVEYNGNYKNGSNSGRTRFEYGHMHLLFEWNKGFTPNSRPTFASCARDDRSGTRKDSRPEDLYN